MIISDMDTNMGIRGSCVPNLATQLACRQIWEVHIKKGYLFSIQPNVKFGHYMSHRVIISHSYLNPFCHYQGNEIIIGDWRNHTIHPSNSSYANQPKKSFKKHNTIKVF